MPNDLLSTRGYYGQDPVGSRLREIVQGRLGGSQMRGASLAAGQRAHGIAQANTANPALAARQASQASATAGAQIADAEARQRMAAQQTALGLLEARRRESQEFAQRMLGGAVGAGASLLGMVVPGLGGAASAGAGALGLPSSPFGRPGPQTDAQPGMGQALGNPGGGQPSAGETAFHGFSQGMPGMGQPQTAWQQYGQAPMMQPPANPYDDLAQGVPAPNYAPQTPQSAMPAERQGPMAPGAAPGTMMRPPQSTMLSAGQPGSYIPSPQPAFEGQPQEQPPALSPMAARLSGMAPVQDIPAPPPPVPTSPSDQFMQLLQQSAFPYLQLDPANLNPLQYLRSR